MSHGGHQKFKGQRWRERCALLGLPTDTDPAKLGLPKPAPRSRASLVLMFNAELGHLSPEERQRQARASGRCRAYRVAKALWRRTRAPKAMRGGAR